MSALPFRRLLNWPLRLIARRGAYNPAKTYGPTPPSVPNLFAWLIANQQQLIVDNHAGAGDAISAVVGTEQTLSDAANPFLASDVWQRINIAGATSPANNGNFWTSNAAGVPAALQYINAAGVAEAAYGGAWTLPGKYSQLTDLQNARPFANAVDAQRPALVTEFGAFNVLARPELVVGSNTVCLSYADASVGGFNAKDVCVSVRCRYATLDGASIAEISAGSTANRLRFMTNSTSYVLAWSAAGATTTLTLACVSPNNAWFTYGARLNRVAGTLTGFIDGVNQGTSPAGTVRTPAAFTTASIMSHNSIASKANYFAGMGLGWSWTDADFMAVHNAFSAYGCP